MKYTNIKKWVIAILLIFFIIVSLWLFLVVPILEKFPDDFRYEADIYSLDSFYDEEKQSFSDPIKSKTKFSYEVISKEGDILTIKNLFDVRKPTGEKIFSVERLYGIDAKTGMHVPGYGDKVRHGYLFAPKKLKKQDYVYWHINYDEPAVMKFQDEEEIFGLNVYRYVSNYNADQTVDLGHLPGVPETRGINLDINLQVWIEPISGRMIKYKDNTTAYYYDILTGITIHPWNKFSNQLTDPSIVNQIGIAKTQKQKKIFLEKTIPILFGLIVILFMISILFISKVASKPLIKLINIINEISKGNLDVKIDLPRKHELSHLSEAVKLMISELKASKRIREQYQHELKNKVAKRTDELNSKIQELESYNKLSVGRELKMIELKKKIKELEKQLNKMQNEKKK